MRRARLRDGRDPLVALRRSRNVVDRIPPKQRLIDLLLVLIALPVALPAGLVIAAAVFLDSPGPVLYRSRRVGRGGRTFAMLKFRTMVCDAGGPPLSAANDERYTPLGRRLARSRLDELPQLWNVIRGQMRVVGPRPELEDFVRDFPEEYEQILRVPPGLTGPTQVQYAWEGEVLAQARAVDRARLYRESILPLKLAIDIEYVRRHSVPSDVWILMLTAVLPLRRLVRRLALADRPRAVHRLAPTLALTALALLLTGVFAVDAGSSP